MKYQAYPEYKDSGVEWLGEVPSHWGVVRLKYVANLEGDKVIPTSEYRYVGMENIESGNGNYLVKDDISPEGLSTSFSKGDVLFGKLRPYLAKSWLADFSGICSSEFLVLRSKKVFPQFLNYYTLTDEFINQVDPSTYGSKMPRASWDFISLMDVPVPRVESEKIANFLDQETAKIDTLIEKQQQLIKLLKEKRQAVISHAVTKGLNPNAPMRDSGVEWLGEVPGHWEVVPLKYLCCLLKDGTHLPPPRVDSGIPLLSVRNIVNSKFIFRDDDSNIAEEDYKNLCKPFVPRKGDVLLAIVGATLGKVAIVEEMSEFHIQRSLAIFRAQPDSMTSEGLANILGSTNFQSLLWENVGFSAQPGIYLGTLENFQLPVPPLEEQNEINEYCKSKAEHISTLILKAESANELIKERRTALISAAVTGKIDVRSWQAPEPFHGNIKIHEEAAA
jgi:type I restriction enzyme S subunit